MASMIRLYIDAQSHKGQVQRTININPDQQNLPQGWGHGIDMASMIRLDIDAQSHKGKIQ